MYTPEVATWRSSVILTGVFLTSIYNTVKEHAFPRAMCSGGNSDLWVKKPKSSSSEVLGKILNKKGIHSSTGKTTRLDQIPKHRSGAPYVSKTTNQSPQLFFNI